MEMVYIQHLGCWFYEFESHRGTITEHTTLNTRKGEPEYAFYLLIKLYNTSLRSNVTYG